jgi:hypothetical protein
MLHNVKSSIAFGVVAAVAPRIASVRDLHCASEPRALFQLCGEEVRISRDAFSRLVYRLAYNGDVAAGQLAVCHCKFARADQRVH